MLLTSQNGSFAFAVFELDLVAAEGLVALGFLLLGLSSSETTNPASLS